MPDTSFEHPDTIGPYHVLQLIGEGGMGVVYEAEQREPVRRRVAVKTMKLGMDSREIVGRFETERQSLAVMDHPGIAKVLDAGVAADGKPYFAMEFVAGMTIDEYCDLQRLDIRRRIEIVIGVCDAVQHAHQKGVIHRDLKPSNILVKEDGGVPQTKIIDFGVAKATGFRLNEHTAVTSIGQAIGTLAYMSPEQAEMSGLDVDTRSDVYSLGIVLNELLVGSVPIDLGSLGAQAYMLHLVQRDASLPTLAQQIAKLEPYTLDAIATRRRTDRHRLRRDLTGDLQWILSKATEKDRNRRYETPNALAQDLRRYLNNEPVVAHAPSTAYRLRKFARRNRNSVVAAGLAAIGLIGGTVGTSIGLIRARRAEVSAASEAEASAQVAEFLAGLFSISDPAEARGRTISARELLDSGASRIAGNLREQPTIRARLSRTIGEVYSGLGQYDIAERLLESALVAQTATLGPDDPQTLVTAYSLGDVYFYRGQYARAESTFADAARLRARRLGPDHPLTIKAQGAVGTSLVFLGREQEAESTLKATHAASVRALGAEDPQSLELLNNLQGLYYRQKRYNEAEVAANEVLAGRRRVFGTDHPASLTALHNLGTIHAAQGRFAQAERELAEAVAGRRRVQGEDHPSTLGSYRALGVLFAAQKRYPEAESFFLRAINGFTRTTGLRNPAATNAVQRLADLYKEMGQPRRADEWLGKIPHSKQ